MGLLAKGLATLLVLQLFSFEISFGKAVIDQNGYEDVVIAISPDISEEGGIIENIKVMMRDASREMYKATRNRAYIRSVKILVPKTWSNQEDYESIEDESFSTAEFRIDKPNPVYGDSPYTVQSVSCGVPGSHIHLTTGYVNNGQAWGNKGKTLVHEWAKLRWGVFEEHGYPGDDKFPIFFLRKSWTSTGEQSEVAKNLCLNTNELYGYQQDIVTGGECSMDPETNLPDSNCYFYASQQTAATSSYMSLPYLSTNVNFCDYDEEYIHDPLLPNKQNLMCEGRSTWEVILTSPDFDGDENNPPNTAITNTDPTFTLVGGGGNQSSLAYVLVMDVSLSMPAKDRFVPMKEAARRWVKYELTDGTRLGLIAFSGENYVAPVMAVTELNDATRAEALQIIDELTPQGRTCIGCGLQMALESPLMLANQTGGIIILITDGRQQCNSPNAPACVSIQDVEDPLVEQKVRVITIALGDEADPEIEDVALATGGKSYFVEDNSGLSDINNAFTGSTTFQPGETQDNTPVTVFEQDWTTEEISEQGAFGLFGEFDIDSTIGSNLTIQLEITKSNNKSGVYCETTIMLQLTEPGSEDISLELPFNCTKENLGVLTYQLDGVAAEGKWLYAILLNETVASIAIKVTAKAKVDEEGGGVAEPILTKCWISTGNQIEVEKARGVGMTRRRWKATRNGTEEEEEEVDLRLTVMAEVKQGNRPVIGARVNASIERPADANGTLYEPLYLELFDNGAGADIIKNDGIYARFFTQYTGKGRYSVKCQVVGENGTQVNNGFIAARKRPHFKAVPEMEGTPMCCGSDTVFPGTQLSDTGAFTRQAAGGSFQVTADVDFSKDILPPGRVIDLKAQSPSCEGIRLEFTSPSDDLDAGKPVQTLMVKYASSMNDLVLNFTAQPDLTADDLLSGSLMPIPTPGAMIQLQLVANATRFTDRQLYFGLKAQDAAGNESPLSNIVSAVGTCRSEPSGGEKLKLQPAIAALFVMMKLVMDYVI